MKNSRRNFLKNTALGVSSIPALSFIGNSNNNQSLDEISSFLNRSDQTYWSEVRNLFPTDKNDTYFNNGTLGVQSNYVLNAVISDMRNNAINGAKTDYKGEEGIRKLQLRNYQSLYQELLILKVKLFLKIKKTKKIIFKNKLRLILNFLVEKLRT